MQNQHLTEQKRRLDATSIELDNCRQTLNELGSQDLTQANLLQRTEIDQLRGANERLQEELRGLKEGIKRAMQTDGNKATANHFTSLLEI